MKSTHAVSIFRLAIFIPLIVSAIATSSLSLSLDETLTYFVSNGNVSEVLAASSRYQGQSPLYFLMQSLVIHYIGSTEYLLRGLSFFCIVGSIFVFQSMCDRNPRVPQSCAVIFAAFVSVSDWALQARPYALCLLCILGATFHLQRWTSDGCKRSYWLWILLSTAAIESVFLSAPFVLLHILFVRGIRRRIWKYLIGVGAIAVLVLLLSGSQLALIASRSRLYSFAGVPAWSDVVEIFDNQLLLFSLLLMAGAMLVTKMFKLAGVGDRPGEDDSLLIGTIWWLFPPLLTLVLSMVFGLGLFLPRYYFWSILGLSLSLGSLLHRYCRPVREEVLLLIALFACGLMLRERSGGFREAIAAAQTACADKLVFFQPGLAESASTDWVERETAYVSAPLLYYPLHSAKNVSLLPAWIDAVPGRSWARRIEALTPQPDSFCLLRRRLAGDDRNLEAIRAIHSARQLAYRSLGSYGDVELGIFADEALNRAVID